MIPLFNGISCVRLGELEMDLFECDLETITGNDSGGKSMIESRDWYAWVDHQPPGPPVFHVVGEVLVANPGIQATLVYRIPQGINPRILLMDLVLVQLPGAWPQILTWKTVRYDRINGNYDSVQVFFKNSSITDIAVELTQ
jgi:hypothetical protein